MARDDQLIENLRARTWPGDCEAAAFRIEELRARVAELEGRQCQTCDGRGEIGGFQGGAAPGYVTEACPECAGASHAHELRRMARKVGCPAGDIPAVMRAAADRLDELVRRLREAEGHVTARIDEAVEAEREACAKLCDDMTTGDRVSFDWERGASDCAHAIRAKNQPRNRRTALACSALAAGITEWPSK